MNVHEHYFKSIMGTTLALNRYQGQPILIVNTASECGYTPQYQKLQRIWNEYRGSGLVVVGIPSNDFGEQEPGDEEEIDAFCRENYGVTFPMTAKYSVIGRSAHPLFIAMVEEYGNDVIPKWNFHKYLFDGKGQLLESWPSAVEPDDPKITHQIERNLHSWIL
ncbi:MAG: glutathione peroxidase [Xanthomonadales bacterium]|nr:glutathione peroxidase [Xanthomonadales bacterium]